MRSSRQETPPVWHKPPASLRQRIETRVEIAALHDGLRTGFRRHALFLLGGLLFCMTGCVFVVYEAGLPNALESLPAGFWGWFDYQSASIRVDRAAGPSGAFLLGAGGLAAGLAGVAWWLPRLKK